MIKTTHGNDPLYDIKEVYDVLREHGRIDDVRSLQGAAPLQSIASLSFDWGLIALCWWAVVLWGWWALPPAVLLIGARQRALGNLLHDGGHKILFPDPEWNDRLANLLIGIPSLSPVSDYRDTHLRHHVRLGVEHEDPDLIHDEADLTGSPWRLLAKHLFSLRMLRVNLFGHLGSMSNRDLANVIAWWVTVVGGLALLAGPAEAGIFFGTWWLARLLVFHPITTFREISDHVGLEPGSTIGFTRNSPHRPILGFFLHPHANNYHLTHHLAPRVPFHRLHRAHEVFMSVPAYAEAHHCDRYFTGSRSLIGCWVRRCADWTRRQRDRAGLAMGGRGP